MTKKKSIELEAPPVKITLEGKLNNQLWLRQSIGNGTLGKREFDTALNIDGRALIVNSGGLSVTFHIPWEEIVRSSVAAMEAYEKAHGKES